MPPASDLTAAALSGALADAVERAARSVVAVHARRQPSSGIVWRPGVVVTTEHTVKRDDEIAVTLPDGRRAAATLAGRDPGTDLAVLRVESDAPPLTPAAGAPKPGQLVLAVARPGAEGPSASFGVLSLAGGPWRTWRGGQVERFLRPDLALYPGFSGGPLIDVGAGCLGVNTGGLTRVGGVTIPWETIERVGTALLESGRVRRGYLGVGLQPVRLQDGRRGALVVNVEAGGPADRAGVLVGDVVLALDGATIGDVDEVQARLGGDRVGATLRATLVRGGGPAEAGIVIGERP